MWVNDSLPRGQIGNESQEERDVCFVLYFLWFPMCLQPQGNFSCIPTPGLTLVLAAVGLKTESVLKSSLLPPWLGVSQTLHRTCSFSSPEWNSPAVAFLQSGLDFKGFTSWAWSVAGLLARQDILLCLTGWEQLLSHSAWLGGRNQWLWWVSASQFASTTDRKEGDDPELTYLI